MNADTATAKALTREGAEEYNCRRGLEKLSLLQSSAFLCVLCGENSCRCSWLTYPRLPLRVRLSFGLALAVGLDEPEPLVDAA